MDRNREMGSDRDEDKANDGKGQDRTERQGREAGTQTGQTDNGKDKRGIYIYIYIYIYRNLVATFRAKPAGAELTPRSSSRGGWARH